VCVRECVFKLVSGIAFQQIKEDSCNIQQESFQQSL